MVEITIQSAVISGVFMNIFTKVMKMARKSFKETLMEIVGRTDVILMVLDARFPLETRNEYIEDIVSRKKKYLIYVINKSDLAPKHYSDEMKRKLVRQTKRPVVFVSSTKRLGSRLLRNELSIAMKRLKKERLYIGIVGYPNVGKSSVINLLKGKAVAKTSWISGLTKGKQFVRINKTMMLYDTPGILDSDDEVLLGLINAKDFDKIDDVYALAKKIFSVSKHNVLKLYSVEYQDYDSLLENVAKKFNKKIKGGDLDTEFAARKIIKDWQRGKITL